MVPSGRMVSLIVSSVTELVASFLCSTREVLLIVCSREELTPIEEDELEDEGIPRGELE